MKDWKPYSEWLCRQIAGDDLAGVPCYFVSMAEIQAYDPRLRGGHCAAWTGTLADLLLCDYLTRAGQWLGRGFGCVVDVESMPHLSQLLATVAHELAHYLTVPGPIDAAGDAELGIALLRAAPSAWANASPEPIHERRAPWHNHGADFCRAACHVATRAGEHVQAIRPSMVRFATPYHGPGCNENTFVSTMGDELESRQPIREILKSEPPKLFSELWSMATDWWEIDKPESTKADVRGRS